MKFEVEIWVDVYGFEDRYQVSNLGRVRGKTIYNKSKCGRVQLKKENIMSTPTCRYGYPQVGLSKKYKKTTIRVHRIMMTSFFPLKTNKKLVVNHIDGNKKNNNLENLEWCTQKENIKHASKMGLMGKNCGENHYASKIDDIQALTILTMSNHVTQKSLAEHYDISPPTVRSLIKGKTRKYLHIK